MPLFKNMFIKKESIETRLSIVEIMDIFEKNICTHSPVLNSKDINILRTDRIFLGDVKREERKIIFWEASAKKRVIVPVFFCAVSDEFDKRVLDFKIELPRYNALMLKFWFLFVVIFSVGNLCYLPFWEDKLMFLLNSVLGAAFFFLSYYISKRIFVKRTLKVMSKLKESSVF